MVNITKPRTYTYLGRKAETFEVRDAGPYGPRWIYYRHIDDADPRNGGYLAGTCIRRRVSGDGRRNTFKVLVDTEVVTLEFYNLAQAQNQQ